MTTQYIVKFQFQPKVFQGGWTNILHLTTGGNCCGYGNRIPGVWFHGSNGGAKTNKLHICSSVNGNGNNCYNSAGVPKGQWTSVEISQLLIDGSYQYTVKLDGKVVHPVVMKRVQAFANVKVYAADNWYNAAQGNIKNLVINPKASMYLYIFPCIIWPKYYMKVKG